MTIAPGFSIPILLLVYRRPDAVRQVFGQIRSVRPSQLFVAADGPRPGDLEESQACAEARQLATAVDWPCDLRTLLREEHLGCGLGVSSAISWFFDNVDEGIVLEDDCVPSRSFFGYCAELLAHYRTLEQVMHIGGDNFQYGRLRGSASYYFSAYAHVWGWATWKRAWRAYDFTLRPSWELRDTWSTQWQLTIEKAHGLAIVPNVNLVRNVGFGGNATHTADFPRAATLEAQEIPLPLRHPDSFEIDSEADRFTHYVHFRNVRYEHFLWAYRLWDTVFLWLRHLKRGLLAG